MKERPILFSAPMVRALLDGSKSQTRRVVKPQFGFDAEPVEMGATNDRGHQISGHSGMWWDDCAGNPDDSVRCPYGQPGDRLWVRENFDFLPAGGPDQPQACEIVYWATGSSEPRTAPCDYNPFIYGREKVRPSIHMPRWASRITLEITGVRVERVQDISESDAVAEGVFKLEYRGQSSYADYSLTDEEAETSPMLDSPISSYRTLWESINGPKSWDANPWVWVLAFRRVEE